MNRLQGYMQAPAGAARVISILSGKGGVGKSVIALNLAERLAAVGRRVLLVDLDLSGGNLHILANARVQDGIAGRLSGQMPLEAAVTSLDTNLDLLGHGAPLTIEEYPSAREAACFANRLRSDATRYDVLLCDHASGVSEFATVIAGASDLNLLVAVPEVTSISDCYGLWKYLCQVNRSIDGRLVVNRAENAAEAEYVAHRLAALSERFVGRPLDMIGFLPDDKAVRQAVAAQCPAAKTRPQAVVVQKLNDIVQALTGGLRPSEASDFNQTINVNAALADTKG